MTNQLMKELIWAAGVVHVGIIVIANKQSLVLGPERFG